MVRLSFFLENRNVYYAFTNKGFRIHLCHHHRSVFGKNDNIVNIAAIRYVFVPF